MKMKFSLAVLFTISALLILSGCKKSDTPGSPSTPVKPTVTTTVESNITSTSAQTGGTISSDGGSSVTERGVCWSTVPTPTIADAKTTDGSGLGNFISTITGLTANKLYYIRAYATNAVGTSYGNQITVLTSNGVPSLTTQPIVVSNNKWITGGTNISDGGSAITQKGVCWSTSPNPTITDSKTTDGTGFLGYSSRAILPANSTCYVRAYATNSYGTGYGNQVTITTTFAIGLLYGGGMIFDVDGTGIHGLIAALADQGTAVPWAPGALFTTQTNATSTTNGTANTTTIINVYGNSGTYAARLCRTYNGGGFNDWFLPSSDQLFKLSGYQDVVGGFPPGCFMCTFNYWSSTEFNNFKAWDQNFNYGSSFNSPQKNQLNYVRAVRAF